MGRAKTGTTGTKPEIGLNRPQTLMNTSIEQTSRTGTGKLEEKKDIPAWADLMTAWRQWLAVGGYSANAQKDFPEKVKLLRRFLEGRTGPDGKPIIDGGRIDLAAIDTDTMGDYQAYVYDYVSRRTGQRLKTQTQIHALSYVQSLFRFLRQTKRIVFDPARVIRLPRQPQSIPSDILTPEEVKRMLAQPDLGTPTGFRDRCLLEVLWSTGMRANELVSLAVEDIDFAQSFCTILHGKGGKQRVVPVGQIALNWLREYIDQARPLLADPHEPTRTGSAPLFLSRWGKRLEKSGLFFKLHAYRDRAGIRKHLTSHSFRHTLATEMLNSGADLRHIQEMLGHEKLTTTQRYLHIAKGDLKKVHAHTHPREVHSSGTSVNYHGERS
jgi:integrase/recombinase XerD